MGGGPQTGVPLNHPAGVPLNHPALAPAAPPALRRCRLLLRAWARPSRLHCAWEETSAARGGK